MLTYEEQRTNAEKIADEILKERVLRGLEVLRKEYGEDWVDYINTDTLDLASTAYCVLGQVENGVHGEGQYYNHALKRIDGDVELYPVRFGFDIVRRDEEGADYGYAELTEAWLITMGALEVIS